MNHGEAVAVGLKFIADAAEQRGLLSDTDNQRINKLIERAGFSVEPPIEMRRVLKSVAKDKKSEGDAIYVVLPESIGSCRVEKMSLDEFKGLF